MELRKSRNVRISFFPLACLIAGLIACAPAAMSQDNSKSDAELPAGEEGKLGPRANAAPQAQGAAPKTETIATHGAWAVQCTELPAEQGGKSCGMIQNTKSDKDERVSLSIVVSRVKRDSGPYWRLSAHRHPDRNRWCSTANTYAVQPLPAALVRRFRRSQP
jgi:invasion protein IalB